MNRLKNMCYKQQWGLALTRKGILTRYTVDDPWVCTLPTLLSHFSRVWLCATPALGFSRQEHWSGLPFPSPVHESEKWKWNHSVMSNSSRPMDCSLPGSSVHGIFQARVLEWGAIAFSDYLHYAKWTKPVAWRQTRHDCTHRRYLLQSQMQRRRGFPCGSAGKESARNAGDLGSIPGLGRSLGEGKGYPLQYSGLDISTDCIIHGVTKSVLTERLSLSESRKVVARRWGNREMGSCSVDPEFHFYKKISAD